MPAVDALSPDFLPDLLNEEPLRRIDFEATDTALVFAFSGSTSGGLFGETLGRARMAPSSWDPETFAADLFVSDFVRSALQVHVRGQQASLAHAHLLNVLTHPPKSPRTVQFRREILAELEAAPTLRGEATELYARLRRFRDLIEGTSAADRWDPNRRQLEILTVFRDLIVGMSRGFSGSRSGLVRLAEFGRRIESGEPFRSLVDLLRYDDRMATVSFRVGMGADGRVRHFELVSVEEEKKNPFVASPGRRWLAKIELFLRGFRFGDGEVMARLIDAVFEGVRAEFTPLVQLFGDLEFYLGALGLADRIHAAGLALCFPELVAPESPREFIGLFNPLLLVAGQKPVPCDVVTDRHDTTLLVTGPNSGGKTRLLQSIGLSQMLAQAGLFVPARRAQMALAPGLVVSLLQETRVDQTEGRLGVELMRIRALFEKLPPGAVVILDELCSGTNPSEGEEIVELVIRTLTRLRPQTYITTHFLEFAGRLAREKKIADLRFLQVVLGPEHEPTYQFAEGVASTSLAARAAARLGVTGEQLLALIEERIARSERERTLG